MGKDTRLDQGGGERRYAFFQHTQCEYFPCHETQRTEDFNCIFCYCPLYALGERCGGRYTYTEDGVKDCKACMIPHMRENYDYITGRFRELATLARKKDFPLDKEDASMIYSDFKGKKLPLLGFGTMRLPQNADGTVDEQCVDAMTQYAMAHGVNYFDTAFPYHNGESERVIGRVLRQYPRDSYFLATKFPGHQVSQSYDPAGVFEAQLKKCGVAHFDFYLLHNVYENSIQTYTDPRWGIMEYFKEQKRLGRIRHLGFSSHAGPDALRTFLDQYGENMEFCQIQLNYLDWTLQQAAAKVELLNARHIPIWVMEPLRGGKLATLNEADAAALRAKRPEDSVASWAFRFLQEVPGVGMILSGMSNMAQMEDNVHSFAEQKPLSDTERDMLLCIADGMKDSVPCTACRYCCDGCPQGLDIPMLLSIYNELRIAPTTNAAMRLDALPEDKRPSACIGCGKCARVCPQGIDVPAALGALDAKLKTIPSWAEICRQRDAAQK